MSEKTAEKIPVAVDVKDFFDLVAKVAKTIPLPMPYSMILAEIISGDALLFHALDVMDGATKSAGGAPEQGQNLLRLVVQVGLKAAAQAAAVLVLAAKGDGRPAADVEALRRAAAKLKAMAEAGFDGEPPMVSQRWGTEQEAKDAGAVTSGKDQTVEDRVKAIYAAIAKGEDIDGGVN